MFIHSPVDGHLSCSHFLAQWELLQLNNFVLFFFFFCSLLCTSYNLDVELPKWVFNLSGRRVKSDSDGRQREGVACLPPFGKCVFTTSGCRSLAEPPQAQGPWQREEPGSQTATREGISSVRCQAVQRPSSTPEESSHMPRTR